MGHIVEAVFLNKFAPRQRYLLNHPVKSSMLPEINDATDSALPQVLLLICKDIFVNECKSKWHQKSFSSAIFSSYLESYKTATNPLISMNIHISGFAFTCE
jgi:hypothetical protein